MFVRKCIECVAVVMVCGLLLGCSAMNASPPMEQMTNKIADKVVIPAVEKALEQGVRSFALQAGAQGVNPTYVIEGEGKWVVGIEFRATVGVEGIAGQMQISSTGDEETEKSPYKTAIEPLLE